MEEQKVTFETAKLAKEKGFDIPYENYYVTYIDDDDIDLYNYEENRGSNFAYLRKNENDFEYSAPTQSLLQKWLREKFNIAVMVSFNDNTSFEYYYFIHTDVSKPCSNRICSLPFKTIDYEQALEKGLQEALKLI